MSILEFELSGQCPSGKNSIIITRTGKHFPSKRFVEWKKVAKAQVSKSIPKSFKTIDKPVNVCLDYFPGDKRRRDVPGIIDALWHLLEDCKIVSDDRYLGGAEKMTVFHQNSACSDPKVIVTLH